MVKVSLSKKDSFDFNQFINPVNISLKKWNPIKEVAGPGSYITFRPCECCKKETENYCQSCLVSAFCSEQCLKEHLPIHLKVCGKLQEYTLVFQESTGYPYYVLTESIDKGAIILRESPFVRLPIFPKEYEKDDGRPVHQLICFTCHEIFSLKWKNGSWDYNGVAKCSQCGIFKCSKICNEFYHNKYECNILQRFVGLDFTSYLTSKRRYSELYFDICILRILCALTIEPVCSYRATNWRKIMLLTKTARFKAFKRTHADFYDDVCYMKILKKSVEALKLSMLFSQDNVKLLQQIFKTMIVFWEEYELHPGNKSRLLFLDRHFMAHSYCAPNVHVARFFNSSGAFPIWAFYMSKPITLESNALKVKLVFDFSPSPFMPIPLRMLYFNEIGLQCDRGKLCNLCNDPTDGGTKSGSILCTTCDKGLLEENDFSSESSEPTRGKPQLVKRWSQAYIEKSVWKCNHCGNIDNFASVLECLQQAKHLYKTIVKQAEGVSALDYTVGFMEMLENSCLHSQNGLILQSKFDYLLAIRERNFKRASLGRHGFVLPFVERHPTLKKSKIRPTISLFPDKWDEEELEIVRRRAVYAEHCGLYLEFVRCKQNKKLGGEDDCSSVEYSFLTLEHALMKLLVCCYNWTTSPKDDNAVSFFLEAMQACIEAIGKWESRKENSIFPLLLECPDPLLILPRTVLVFKKFIALEQQRGDNDRQRTCFLMTNTILTWMSLSLENFLLNDRNHIEQFALHFTENSLKWTDDQKKDGLGYFKHLGKPNDK